MTASSTDVDGAGDVNDFLLRIRELGERRDKEDEERTKKLEEEILQGRKERQARRAERARSISPIKDSPLSDTFRLSASSLNQRAIDPPECLEPTVPASDLDTSYGLDHSPEAPINSELEESKPSETEMDPAPRQTPTSLRSRAGTLSWQQRPPSRGLNSLTSTSPTRGSHLRTASTISDDLEIDRDQIASSLPPKDASSLSHTTGHEPDSTPVLGKDSRGRPTDTAPSFSSSLRSTGLNRESIMEPEKPAGVSDRGDEQRPSSPSRQSSTIGDSSFSHRHSSISSVSTASGLGSPVPLSSAQKFEPSTGGPVSDDHQVAMPPSPKRMSPERSNSPTKGLGGFVQSAMMKRSDSISKRWSTQMSPGLSGINRTSSVASNRNSLVSPTRSDISSTPTGSKLHQEGPSSPPYRPNSNHSEATSLHQAKENERPTTPPARPRGNSALFDDSPSRRPPSLHLRSPSALGWEDQNTGSNAGSPMSSRTIDSKRWSPTKASWLESALNRPDSPRHTKQPSQSSPWSATRQSRGSVDLGRRSNPKDVIPPVGLMRTAAPGAHYKKPSISGIPDLLNGPDASKAREPAPERSPQAGREPVKETLSESISDANDDEAKANVLSQDERIPHTPPPPTEKIAQHESSPATTITDDTKDRPSSPASKSSNPSSPSPRDSIVPRPRPQSPVVDFRANLRRREAPKDNSQKEEPEFKNVFGKLKRTQTANYVAPDEFKENILRGKASLNTTGGPKKTQRVDEFKESILKQKEAMKAGGGSLRRNTAGENDAPKKLSAPIPEAIAKRNNMTNIISGKENRSSDAPSSPSPEESKTPRPYRARQQSSLSSLSNGIPPNLDLPRPVPAGEPSQGETESQNRNSISRDSGRAVEEKAVDLEKKLDDGNANSSPRDAREEGVKSTRALPSDNVAQPTDKAALTGGRPIQGKLAGRINPALAGLLSRGPPTAGSQGSKGAPLASTVEKSTSESSKTGPLTHMTKNRTRGPARRLPKAAAVENIPVGTREPGSPNPATESFPVKQVEEQPKAVPATSKSFDDPNSALSPDSVKDSPDAEETTSEQATSSLATEAAGKRDNLEEIVKSKPSENSETPKKSSPASLDKAGLADVEVIDSADKHLDEISPSKPAVPPKQISPPSSALTETRQGIRGSDSSSSPSPLKASLERDGMRMPPPPMDSQNATTSKSRVGGPREMPLREKSLPPPPKASENSQGKRVSEPPLPPVPSTSVISDAATSKAVISSFFNTVPSSSARVNIDPQAILTNGNENLKIRTLKKQIWEITGDAKRQDLPINQEYILYEGSMYLCVHMFEAEGSTRTEVQLWCGDDVPEAAIDEAQGFARKVAKENGCKLELLKQGKETARFIQARGGIMITRRGFNSRASSSALYMLCGRRHLGQVVFDEVDLSRWNLCSGYPFVISAPFGKLYLWKGKGSGAEEIGAARLIGMDLGLTGEIEEVTEGAEPESFFENFPDYKGKGEYVRSEYWQLKPNHAHFRTRLLRIDHELGQRSGFWMRRPSNSWPVVRPSDTLQEIVPFSYKDLSSKDIFILDIFFEIYVIVGCQASHRSAEFASALVFAHEYGIMAASLQDRPFIPKSMVSIGGLPASCRSVFRKWDKRSWQLPLRVLTLNAAIDAIRP